MNKAKRDEYISHISDSITIIRGNAELALKVERPKWVDRYLSEIIKETDTTAMLLWTPLNTAKANVTAIQLHRALGKKVHVL
ncbi:MAG: hypothetical protein M1609_00705 [Firmicutes bacterium]|nr:hypothetical protein [Bacillota bacterium]MCL5057473.1 hypothetical protein [Actinomycetota bacterium]